MTQTDKELKDIEQGYSYDPWDNLWWTIGIWEQGLYFLVYCIFSTVNVLKFKHFSFCYQGWYSQNAHQNSKQGRPWSGLI